MSEVRLIDANAAISVFADMGQDIDTHDVIDLLKEQPTVDAVPVRHGYNKQIKFPSQFTCSICGWESWDTYCCDTDTFNYCPNCGAKMDGADEERRSE